MSNEIDYAKDDIEVRIQSHKFSPPNVGYNCWLRTKEHEAITCDFISDDLVTVISWVEQKLKTHHRKELKKKCRSTS